MTSDPLSPESQPRRPTASEPPTGETTRVTRAGMVWVATATGLVLLILLIIFILQNQDRVTLRYFGLEGSVSLGVGLFIGAVGGGVLVAVAGAARIIQLRTRSRRVRLQGRRGATGTKSQI